MVVPVPDKKVAVTTGKPNPQPVGGANEEKWPVEEIFVTVIAWENTLKHAKADIVKEKSIFLNIVLFFGFDYYFFDSSFIAFETNSAGIVVAGLSHILNNTCAAKSLSSLDKFLL